MIRKLIVVVLTLATVGTMTVCVLSHIVWADHVGRFIVTDETGFSYSFEKRTHLDAETWLTVECSLGYFCLTCWHVSTSPAISRWWGRWGFTIQTGALAGEDPPINRVFLSMPLWFPIVLFASYPVLAFIRGPLRRYLRRRKGLCLSCGYDLTGNVSGVCPECGTEVPPP